MLTDYPPNSHVSVHITGVIAPGLRGQVDSIRAIIRNREIAWGQTLPLPEYVGQTREALVLGFNPDYRELELSLRLAERDPWQGIATKYPPGSEVQGRVVGLIGQGAFVEIEPAVEGFLPVRELLSQTVERIEDWLWIEDQVKAMITEVDLVRRRLRLSLRELLWQREAHFQQEIWSCYRRTASSETLLAAALPEQIRLQLLQIERLPDVTQQIAVLNVLVVEDDEVFRVGLTSLLKHNGCAVTSVKDAITALEEVHRRNKPFDLILVNWGLPGMKGDQLIGRLQEDRCPSRLAMVLEPAPLGDHPEIWERLRNSGVDVFSKANGDHCKTGLVSLLTTLRANGDPPQEPRRRFFLEVNVFPEQTSPSPSVDEHVLVTDQRDDWDVILSRLQRDTRATTVMLLCSDPGSGCLVSEGCVGRLLPFGQAPPDLIYSPLGDVLQKGQEIWEDVTPDAPRFKRLLGIFLFQGFLGMPLPGLESPRYGLFLFKSSGSFGSEDFQRARTVAYLLSGMLQRRQFIKTLESWQAQNLAGQLVNSVIHEVNNKLSGVQYQVEFLQGKIKELRQWPGKAADPAFLVELEQAVEKIADAQREATRLRDHYLGLTVSDEPQLVDLRALTQDMVHLLRPEAQHHNIVLERRLSDDLPPVRARPSQLRQIFLNLTLNTIQQMVQLERQGKLTIAVSHCPDAPRPVQVRFIDEGPGIHAQLCERIFDFGFTTRKKGAGLGLTISRQVAASLGGDLRVEESHILWGTTFLLELPKGG